MGVLQPVRIDPTGKLDATNPASGLPAGTLIEAVDTASRWLGPRRGSLAYTHARTYPTSARRPWAASMAFDGNNDYTSDVMDVDTQRDMGTRWTLDVGFDPYDFSLGAYTEAQICGFRIDNTIWAVRVYLLGPGSGGNTRKIKVSVTPTSSRGVAGTTVSITGATQITLEPAVGKIFGHYRHDVRVVRDGANLYLYVDGVLDASATTLSATQPHQGTAGQSGKWFICNDTPLGSNDLFRGEVYWFTIRDGVYQTNIKRNRTDLSHPWAKDVRLHVVCSSSHGSAQGNDHSRFGRHDLPAPTGNTILYPFLGRVQGLGHFTDREGRGWNVALVGGVLYWLRTGADFSFNQARALSMLSATAEMSPFHRTQFFTNSGAMILANGVTPPLRLRDLEADTSQIHSASLFAPTFTLRPSVSSFGTGRVFGQRLRYAARGLDSSTGEVTGLSIFSRVLDVGRSFKPGGLEVAGQKVTFRFEDRDTLFPANPNIDKLQVFRNTSGQEQVFYLLPDGEVTLPTSAGTYVDVVDNSSDEELETDGEVHDLRSNPKHLENHPGPLVHMHAHPSGWTWYYGVERMGTLADNVEFTEDENLLASTDIPNARVGQKIITQDFTETREYRIVSIQGGIWIFPAALDTGVSDVLVVDDRDGRLIWPARPGLPTDIDLEEILTIGRDREDPILFIFQLLNKTRVITRRRIWTLEEDVSESPASTYREYVSAEEGQWGFHAGAVTPFGYVFVNERGPRIFDGEHVSPLGDDSPLARSMVKGLFDLIEPSQRPHTLVVYDPENHRVLVSYVPLGGVTHEECLVYDPYFAVWRGPWNRRVFSAGRMLDRSGADRLVLGDDLANLHQEENQAYDVVKDTSGTLTLTGTVTSVTVNGTRLVVTGADFRGTEDLQQLEGCPIILNDGTDDYRNYVERVEDDETIYLLHRGSTDVAAGWTFKIGAIFWQITTGYLDGGEPVQVKKAGLLRIRYDSPDVALQTMSVLFSTDGSTSFSAGESTNPITLGTVATLVRPAKGGVSFQIRLKGVTVGGDPKITNMGVDLTVERGQAL